MNEHQSSQEWLRVRGLEAAGLSLPQILCSLGFQQRSGDVQALGKPVSSQYCTRLFLQHPDQAGHVYNLVKADEVRLQELEVRLVGVVDGLKQRLKWLNSGSRKQCGVVSERKVVLAVLGSCSIKGRKARPSLAVQAASCLLQEQGSHLTHLNIVSGGSQWKEQLAEVTGEAITEASQWLHDTTPTPARETTPTLIAALGCEQVEAAYIIVEGNQRAEELGELAGEVQSCSVVAHVVVLDCKSSALLEQCQHLATACGGRCHADGGKEGSLCLPRPDVVALWRELEEARNTLAQVQALRLEVAERTRAYHDRMHAPRGSSQCTPLQEKRRVHSNVSKPAPFVRKTPPSQGSREKTPPSQGSREKTPPSQGSQEKTLGKKAGKRYLSKPGASPEQTTVSRTGQGTSIGRCGNVLRGHTVLASCKHDGFYYKGSVVRSVVGGSVKVRFVDRTEETTPLTQLLVVGGAGPRPLLKCGDHVLCCVRQSRGWHCSEYGVCDFYVPARVQVVPDDLRRGHALFTVTTLSGEQVSCNRSGLEKISKSRYLAACSQICHHHQQTSRHTQTEEVATQPSQQHTTPDEEDSHDRVDSHSMSGNAEREPRVASHLPADPELLEGEERAADLLGTEEGAAGLPGTEEGAAGLPGTEEGATGLPGTEEGAAGLPGTEEGATGLPGTEEGAAGLLGTEERGTSVRVSTREQAVGTGPLMVDHSTVTLPITADKQVGTSQEETDFPESPEVGLVGCRVLCRWPDGGWYYRAIVMGRGKAGDSWILQAESGEVADIPASDIITGCQPQPILAGSAVLGPHPHFPDSYAPGKVMSTSGSGYTVLFYDNTKKQCLCDEVQPVPPGLYEEAVSRLEEREKSWVGQAVVARRDSDGVYCPAVVSERLDGQCFELQWADGGHQEQSILHMFGPLTTRRALHAGDHVLGLAMPGLGVCLPGTITGRQEKEGALEVKFSDGERQVLSSEKCFWISPAYFMSAVEYISTAFSSQNQLL